MPLYDYQCSECEQVGEHMLPLDRHASRLVLDCLHCGRETDHEQVLTFPNVNSYFINGGAGRTFTNVESRPVNFHSEAQYRKFLRSKGYRDKDL